MLPFKVVLGIILVIAAAYFAIVIYQGIRSPMTTAIASESSINREFSIVGYFVRKEKVIEKETDGILLYSVDDGEKLGRFDEYAAVYSNISAAELRSIIRSYEGQMDVLKHALSASGSADSISDVSSQIYSGLRECAILAGNYDYSRLGQHSADLKNNIIIRNLADTTTEEIQSMIDALSDRCETLSTQIGSSEVSLSVDESGYFSSRVDGYESVFDVDDLSLLKPSDLNRITSRQYSYEGNPAGKIVTGFGGYFIANISSSDAESLTVGRKIQLKLDAMGDELLEMRVESISVPELGEVTVVFSYNRHVEELINMRKQSAVVILETYNGLKVPREAVRMDEENHMGVYVITGLYTQFKKINVLYETAEYYIVETDPTTTTSLLRGDTIIVGGKKLSDGKVI